MVRTGIGRDEEQEEEEFKDRTRRRFTASRNSAILLVRIIVDYMSVCVYV